VGRMVEGRGGGKMRGGEKEGGRGEGEGGVREEKRKLVAGEGRKDGERDGGRGG